MRVRYEMNQKELERLEKDSIYTLRINNDLKDQVINGYLSELNKVVKKEVKRKELVVLALEVKANNT
jgi:hypothetical protein